MTNEYATINELNELPSTHISYNYVSKNVTLYKAQFLISDSPQFTWQ